MSLGGLSGGKFFFALMARTSLALTAYLGPPLILSQAAIEYGWSKLFVVPAILFFMLLNYLRFTELVECERSSEGRRLASQNRSNTGEE